ncbi:MAG: phage/plasmid primase, P4 family [Pseudomonadota bacterium]
MGGADAIREAFEAAEAVTPMEQGPPAPTGDSGAGGRGGGGGDGGGPPRPGSGDEGGFPPEVYAEGALLPLNDVGNGRRFALYFGDRALFVPRVGWHVWDGRRWKLDPDDIAVRRLAQKMHEHIAQEVHHVPLTADERAAEARIAEIPGEIRALSSEMAPDEKKAARKRLEAEKRALMTALWGRGSTRQRHITHARSAGNTNAIKNMLTEAVPRGHRDVEDLDADPYTVNTASGILRFVVTDMRAEGAGLVAEVRVEPHAREVGITGRNAVQYLTKIIPAEYDPDADCPGFDAFLSRVVPDADMRGMLQRWFGLSLTGEMTQQFLYLYGMGANGKSLLATLMRKMLGEYATMVRIESLTGQNRKSGSDATPDLMKLIGARAAITNEPQEGEKLQEQKVKEMTGGDSMLVRQLHSDFVEFTPYFKLTFIGNHKLEIRGTDDGIWRRPLLFPFNVQIPEAERDIHLGDRLFETERSGILNWMVQGALDYLEGGLQPPQQVLEATAEYRSDSDPIGEFLVTACRVDAEAGWTSARDVIDACYLYQIENNAQAWQPGTLARRIKERADKFIHPTSKMSFSRHKSNGTWGYRGIALKAEWADKIATCARNAKDMPIPRRGEVGGSHQPAPSAGDVGPGDFST